MTALSEEVNRLLAAWSNGDQDALNKLIPLVYGELRQMAKRHMRGQPAHHTLETAALVHEAYLKLVNQPEKQWQNRAHFFSVAAKAMRHILTDYARMRLSEKRGGGERAESLDETVVISKERAAVLVALDDALQALAQFDPRKSRVVEMRHFGGLSVQETADVLKISTDMVMRDWRLAKAWLFRELSGESCDEA